SCTHFGRARVLESLPPIVQGGAPMKTGRGVGTRFAAIGSSFAGVGAAATAAAGTFCCFGPAAVSILGVGGAVATAALKPYRGMLLLGSLALLVLGFWLTHQPKTVEGVAACPTRAGRMSRRIVWGAAIIWLLAVLLPILFTLLS